MLSAQFRDSGTRLMLDLAPIVLGMLRYARKDEIREKGYVDSFFKQDIDMFERSQALSKIQSLSSRVSTWRLIASSRCSFANKEFIMHMQEHRGKISMQALARQTRAFTLNSRHHCD